MPRRRYPTRVRTVGANAAFLINLLGSVPASGWVESGHSPALIASGIAAANLVAGILVLLLPETCGVSLGGDGETQGEGAALKSGGKAPGAEYGTTSSA